MFIGGEKRRLTKIVGTIGRLHGSSHSDMVERFHLAGLDVARLNMSHCDKDYKKEQEILDWARRQGLPDRGIRVATLGDLQGPKVRIGTVGQGSVELPEGAEVLIRAAEHSDDPAVLPIPEELARPVFAGMSERCIAPGATVPLLLGDGEITLDVSRPSGMEARAKVRAGGTVRSRMGFTPKGVDFAIDPFTPKDRADLEFLVRNGATFVGVSFVRSGEDLRRIRYFVRDHLGVSHHVPLIAKIETAAAVANIKGILDEADGIMVARGDLGLQIDMEEVPQVQKRLVRLCRLVAKPVIIATQMLESMTFNPEPTRAEVTDVFNAILDGCDAVMLSGETSRGDRPEQAIRVMARIASQAEMWRETHRLRAEMDHMRIDMFDQYGADTDARVRHIADEVSVSAARLAEEIGCRVIGAVTNTGGTARRISRVRSTVPIVAAGSDPSAMAELLLSYGVHPILLDDAGHTTLEERAGMLSSRLREIGFADRGDLVVVVSSLSPWPQGGTNALHVHQVA